MDRRSRQRRNGYALSRDLTPQLVSVADCKPLGRETRKHPPHQLRKLSASLEQNGFVLPILTDSDCRVVNGWALVLAARQLGLSQVPAVRLTDLSDAKLRMLRLALNRIAEDAEWDREGLSLEFRDLFDLDLDCDIEFTGFDMGEIDVLLDEFDGWSNDTADQVPAVDLCQPAISQPGDLWQVGDHRLLCADATQSDSFERLMGTDLAQMVFTDPPYNVPIDGHVSGLGAAKHNEFAMASGEMEREEYTDFPGTGLRLTARHSQDGAIHFIFMDWRHMPELVTAGRGIYSELKNICVWNKTNSGMGSLYRSQHELVAVFKKGTAPHINNIELGRHGRNRTNVWTYPGMNSFGTERDEMLHLHPTVKPVALVEDAIKDCSKRGGIILDTFAGAGTTLIAAERCGRRGFGLEIEPRYVDLTLRRFRDLTGVEPIQKDSGLTLKEIEVKGRPDRTTPKTRVPIRRRYKNG